MMGTKNNPAPSDCYQRAGNDEPMFTLLARDKTAGPFVRMWGYLRKGDVKGADAEFDALCVIAEDRRPKGDDATKAEEAIRCAGRMEAYRERGLYEHGGKWPVGDPAYLWPALDTMALPDHHNDRTAHPVMQVLAQAVTPWGLASVYRNLQLGGHKIPFHAEEETAAALYFMLGHALRHGNEWRHNMVYELREMQARGIDAIFTAAGWGRQTDA